jgi:6,7-dimethyl-8-ribityllumazine synthase
MVGIVVSEFNAQYCEGMLQNALKVFEGNVSYKVVHVPGAYEIPAMAKKMAQNKSFKAILGIGCLIRGDTPHFEYISQAVSYGLMKVGIEENLPVIFGVLTTDTEEQALIRSEGEMNKGKEVAEATLKMLEVFYE